MTDFALERESQEERIRALYRECGGTMGMREFFYHCRDAGIWDEVQVEGFQIQGGIARIKRALARDPQSADGLPFAAAIGKGKDAPWKQRELFTEADYATVIGLGIEAELADHARLEAWQRECRRRFGTAPSIPQLVY